MSNQIIAYVATRVRYDHNAGDGWRSRLAWWLRRLAARVDDVPATTICVAMDSHPEVPDDAVSNAITQGVEVMGRLHREAVEAETAELALRYQTPELMKEEQ